MMRLSEAKLDILLIIFVMMILTPGGLAFNNSETASTGDETACTGCHEMDGFSYTTITGEFEESALGVPANSGIKKSESFVAMSQGGGPDCVYCHDMTGNGAPLEMRIDALAMKQGVHSNLNNGSINTTELSDMIDKACWACHGNGTEPISGHPDNYATPYSCGDCHNRTSNLTYTNLSLIPDLTTEKVYEHVQPPYYEQISSTVNSSNADCKGCHDKSKINYADSGLSLAANVSHYASRTSLISPTVNCSLCHKNAPNANAYWANKTRHPARSEEDSFCRNCHNTTLATDLHSQSLTKPSNIHVWFDWQGDDYNEIAPIGGNEGCQACHVGHTGNYPAYSQCEYCHLSTGIGPAPGSWYRSDINDTIPPVYAHTNFSTEINVPNQSSVYPPSPSARTFSSCYSFNSSTLAGTCHGISYDNRSISGDYYAFRTSSNSRSSPYHTTKTIDRMPNSTNCIFCHNQTSETIRFAWGNGKQITGGTHNWYTGNDNSQCWSCHVSTGTAPKDFHSETMRGGSLNACMVCHPTVTSSDLGQHSTFNGTSAVDNGDCQTCHYGSIPMVPGGVNNANTYYCADCHTAAGTAPNKSSKIFTEKMHGEARCMDCHVADGTFHQDNPRGSVANTTYIGRYAPGNTTVTDCADCHYKSNLDDAPFNAPAGGSHIQAQGGACAGGCHGSASTMVQKVHSLNVVDWGVKPSITAPSVSPSTVQQGTDTTITATVTLTGIYGYVDGVQYRIMSGTTEIFPWTPMSAVDGNFNGTSEAATAIFNTTTLSADTYSVEVRGMAGGPPQNPAMRYYPMNGDISTTKNATLAVLAPAGYINGTVTDGVSALMGVKVFADDPDSTNYTTGSDGNYSLRILAGVYNVTASRQPEYYDNVTTDVMVTPDNTTLQDIVLTLKPTGNISGIVTNAN